jgi:hypothetical protein
MSELRHSSLVHVGGPSPRQVPTAVLSGSGVIESSIADELGGQIKLNYPSAGFHAEIELPIDNIST